MSALTLIYWIASMIIAGTVGYVTGRIDESHHQSRKQYMREAKGWYDDE